MRSIVTLPPPTWKAIVIRRASPITRQPGANVVAPCAAFGKRRQTAASHLDPLDISQRPLRAAVRRDVRVKLDQVCLRLRRERNTMHRAGRPTVGRDARARSEKPRRPGSRATDPPAWRRTPARGPGSDGTLSIGHRASTAPPHASCTTPARPSSAARHRYHAAVERNGAQAAPSSASPRGFGCAARPCSRR